MTLVGKVDFTINYISDIFNVRYNEYTRHLYVSLRDNPGTYEYELCDGHAQLVAIYSIPYYSLCFSTTTTYHWSGGRIKEFDGDRYIQPNTSASYMYIDKCGRIFLYDHKGIDMYPNIESNCITYTLCFGKYSVYSIYYIDDENIYGSIHGIDTTSGSAIVRMRIDGTKITMYDIIGPIDDMDYEAPNSINKIYKAIQKKIHIGLNAYLSNTGTLYVLDKDGTLMKFE